MDFVLEKIAHPENLRMTPAAVISGLTIK